MGGRINKQETLEIRCPVPLSWLWWYRFSTGCVAVQEQAQAYAVAKGQEAAAGAEASGGDGYRGEASVYSHPATQHVPQREDAKATPAESQAPGTLRKGSLNTMPYPLDDLCATL